MNLTTDATMPAMAARVLEQAPETFALAGLSMGGYCALEIIHQAPERVTRLALLDTSAEPDTPDRTEIRMQWIDEAAAGGFEDLIPRHARRQPRGIGHNHLSELGFVRPPGHGHTFGIA